MKTHTVKVYPSAARLPREEQLAWKVALLAADPVEVENGVEAMIVNRVIDNAAVALAAINREPVANARAQALAHPHPSGATLFGLGSQTRVAAEWAAWANATAVRELDFHDTFLAADYAHPGDNIAPLIAVAQQMQRSGRDLIRGIATAYEVHIALVKAMSLHKHKIDHMAHLCPATAAGLTSLLKLDPAITYQAVNQAVHVAVSTRQSRKGEISSWKAYVPGHSGKLAIEAVDRAMRGEKAPSPIYEGEDSLIARVLDGPEACYKVPLPEAGEAKRAILESYTKAHSAEYQAQAFIDLAFGLRSRVGDIANIREIVIYTSHHTHYVIGSGANDPQKFDPDASRETLDHSLMYIFAVALQDGRWHHVESYSHERAHRPDTLSLWKKIRTVEDEIWTERYHHPEPSRKAFGGRVRIVFDDGTELVEELRVADAHPNGAAPFERKDYVGKFKTLTAPLLTEREGDGFIELIENLANLDAATLLKLNLSVAGEALKVTTRDTKGIF